MSFRHGSGQFHPGHHDVPGGIAEEVIPCLEIQSGTPLICEFDGDLKQFPDDFSSRLMESPSYHLEYLENMTGVVIPGLEFPCGTPWVCEVDADLRPMPKESSSRLIDIPSVPSKVLGRYGQ